MNYVSVCSGIEAATVAWHPLGWKPLLFAEISKFPSAVLAHHHPGVPNVGDFTSIQEAPAPCDLLVGGTPCQAFSIAGLRGGLSDSRGNLALEFCRLADRLRPRWILWENVPGVLSRNEGRDFGSILGALGQLGYGLAYRVLDAQFCGVPQRRRRVFVVGYLGDWRCAAAVLSERTSMRRDTQPRNLSPAADGRAAFSITPESGQGARLRAAEVDVASGIAAVTLSASTDRGIRVLESEGVRRLTPLEVERLQGFPDGYTAIPGCSDAARYHALGNSMAVPVMAFLGRRIQAVEAITVG